MEKEYISSRQCMFLLIGCVVGMSLMLIPSFAITLAKQDAWLVPWLGLAPGLLLIVLLVSLNKMYPGQSFIQYSTKILGVPGYLLGLIMLWFFLFLGALNLRGIVSFVLSNMLFETPPVVIYFFTLLISAYAIKMGLEVMARAFSILIIITLISVVIIQGFSMSHINPSNMFPIFSQGLLPVVHAGINFTAFPVGESIFLFGMILYQVKNSQGITGRLSVGFILALLILFLVIERAILTLGPERTSRTTYAVTVVINATPGGALLLPFMTLNWFIFSLCEFILCYYAFVTGLAHWAKLTDYKPLILPAGALFIVLGISIFNNAIEAATFSSTIYPVYAIPIVFGLPLLLWVVAVIKSNLNRQPKVR